jgi:GT2 family glycosyltransferase
MDKMIADASPASICAAICTRDRPQQLGRALRSLLAQTRPPAEILVVDNAPQSATARTLIGNEFPTIRYVQEPVPGLDFARNRALREATQEIVAFLDDDAVAEPGWVMAIEAVFCESAQIAVCTGKVEALSLETAGQRLFEANGGFSRGNERIRLPNDVWQRRLYGVKIPLIAWSIRIGIGCSLAVRRQTILEIGGFDEALDMGPALHGGGDVDILWRALEAGYEVVYEPKVQVRHEHRREVEAVITQIIQHNRAMIAFLTKAATSTWGAQRLSILVYLLWRLAKPVTRLARRAIGRDPLPAAALRRLCLSCWQGLSAYTAARRLVQRHANGKNRA